jgi:predicted Fe-Mo cluster-binding NifX family protein
MKICICATGPTLDSQVSPVFGRCPYFLIVDSKTKKFKAIANPALQAGRGAGVGAGQLVVSEGAKAVICGNFGPNAFSVLQMSGIKVYPGVFGLTIKQTVDKYNKGELKETKVPSAPGRFGPSAGGRGFGPGLGRRGGR